MTGVFFGSDFITVTKTDGEWQQLKPAILGAIMEHFMSGEPLVHADAGRPAKRRDEFYDAKDADTVATIKELIETRVRPAVANDGGDITFRGFKDGVVYLNMKGACSGCPSSTATLGTASRTCCAITFPTWSRSGRCKARQRRGDGWRWGLDAAPVAVLCYPRCALTACHARPAIDTALAGCSAAVLDTDAPWSRARPEGWRAATPKR